MEKTQKTLNAITDMKLRTNGQKLHQTDARKLKEHIHNTMREAIQSMGLIVTEVDNALIVEFPHTELGAIPIEAKFIVKPLDYDIMSANAQYVEKQDKQHKKNKKKA